jgi:endoglycosylceramidase
MPTYMSMSDSRSKFHFINMLHTTYLCIVSLVVVHSYSQLSPIRVDPNTQQFIDEYGRVRIFHGVNVVYKVPPYVPDLINFDPQNSLTENDLNNLHEWGFNVVRFYTSWMGVNPNSDKDVDQTYLSQLSTAIDMMESKGIYALLDCHQDIFSRYFCGEGAPDWLTKKFNESIVNGFPFPLASNITRDPSTNYPVLDECLKRPFFEYYFTQAVTNGFKML